ncbi:MAG: hypothetical protein MUC94_04770, partial [bacterium]|nr:hypothetical protein [bacterium]
LTALVATATLELGIDMGAIDLVCQVESPKGVARGLQRVGRAGHLFQLASKGRLIPKTRADLLETTVITAAMHRGDVSPIKISRNCLDILAQQIIAIIAMKPWGVEQLYHFVRQAYPYQNLPKAHFYSVLEMISGRYPATAFKDLKPRISWDRVNNILHALPGSQRTAILGGGAIPDTGQYGCYLEDGVTKIGELEEEFIYERRLGEVFVLGTNNWRIKKITHDRVIVAPAPEEAARMPFWKGEFVNRSFHLGKLYAQFCRELSHRIEDPRCDAWLEKNFSLDPSAAKNLLQFFKDQKETSGVIPDEQTILIESFHDELGDPRIMILSPFGGRVHLAWKLAILAQFRQQLGIEPESLHSDGGIVFRYPVENINHIIQIIKSVTSQNVEELVVEELANSSFFGIRFRHNANRAMLIPHPKPGKRSPLWLQRMRSRDLLEIARKYPSFPIVIETYRECLQDFLAVAELKELLHRIETNDIQLVIRNATLPSPFSTSLMFEFMGGYMYNYDEPKATDRNADLIDKNLIQELIAPENVTDLLDEKAIEQIEHRLQGEAEGYQARTPTELVELIFRIGDLTDMEIQSRVSGDWQDFIKSLIPDLRLVKIFIPNVAAPWRWIVAEDFTLYRDAFANPEADENSFESYKKLWFEFDDGIQSQSIHKLLPNELITSRFNRIAAQKKILERYLWNHTLVSINQIITRYPFETSFVQSVLDELQQSGNFITIPLSATDKYYAPAEIVERIRRVTLRQQRAKIQACDAGQFVEFLLRWQNCTDETKLTGADSIIAVIEKLQGLSLPAEMWESEIFARRIHDYHPNMMDELCRQGEIIWYGVPTGSGSTESLAFSFREDFPFFRKFAAPRCSEQYQEIFIAVRQALHKIGACFISDLSLETGLPPSVCAAALWEMIWQGEVTNDTFSVIRAGKPPFSLHDRSDKMNRETIQKRYGRTHRYRPVPGSGRWSLLPVPKDENILQSGIIEILARQLLLRYGMICREIYELETWQIPWREMVRLEWRGEIRRGYFVKGFSGMQFALPQAADELMTFHQKVPGYSIAQNSDQMILINCCDPANFYGAASPLPVLHPLNSEWRLLRHPNNYLIIHQGIPILAIEAKGTRLTPLRDLSNDELRDALNLLPRLLDDPAGWRRIRSIKVELWNGQPIRNSMVVDILKEIGFRDDFKAMILEKSFE